MIQVYADGKLVADTRLEGYGLTELITTTGLNKSGTAIITMPPNHPAYDAFVSYRTIVKIYEDGVRVFRGRALYPEDDFDNNRTITCEGEGGFFRDSVMRPYIYLKDPADIFRAVVDIHNAQTDPDKRFTVGNVTVTDPNGYIRFEAETAEQVGDTLDKLVDRCGGFIVFTETEDGAPVIHWLERLDYVSNQVIEFGANLLDFARSGASTDPATRIVPYGAKDETTGERLTIKSVNGGLDYIQDDEAVEIYGLICKPVFFDDVTIASNLLTKAKQHLARSKPVVTSLELTAFDLSAMNKSLDSFRVGDIIHVRSAPHKLDDDFQLTDKKRNHLEPTDGKITMGKEVATLTGAGVSTDRKTTGAIQTVERQVKPSGRSGWKDLALDELFVEYGEDVSNCPRYKADGCTVVVTGAVSPVEAYTSDESKVVFAVGIPSHLCPSSSLSFVCQGSGMNRWQLTIEPDGTLTVSCYGTTAPTIVGTTAKLIFTATYTI